MLAFAPKCCWHNTLRRTHVFWSRAIWLHASPQNSSGTNQTIQRPNSDNFRPGASVNIPCLAKGIGCGISPAGLLSFGDGRHSKITPSVQMHPPSPGLGWAEALCVTAPPGSWRCRPDAGLGRGLPANKLRQRRSVAEPRRARAELQRLTIDRPQVCAKPSASLTVSSQCGKDGDNAPLASRCELLPLTTSPPPPQREHLRAIAKTMVCHQVRASIAPAELACWRNLLCEADENIFCLHGCPRTTCAQTRRAHTRKG